MLDNDIFPTNVYMNNTSLWSKHFDYPISSEFGVMIEKWALTGRNKILIHQTITCGRPTNSGVSIIITRTGHTLYFDKD